MVRTRTKLYLELVILAVFLPLAILAEHPCTRKCDDMPKICEYDFTIDWYYTLSKACYDCPYNKSDCDRKHCVPADGVQRSIMVANRQLPGPGIHVCEGDIVVVNVNNKMTAGTSIHWHGIHQRKTPYMDGVSMVTQCPIQPHSSFQYRFAADVPGTHFWHAHTGIQRSEGLFGDFVIRQSRTREPHNDAYDFDLPEHTIMVNDWTVRLAADKFSDHHHDDGNNKPRSMLINGRGRYKNFIDPLTNETAQTPVSVFHVRSGYKYRFRVASNGILYCPIQFSIDGHNLTMIASDGAPFKPLEVETFIIDAGERYDFVLNAREPVGNYWIKTRGLADCYTKHSDAHQVAILRYDGVDSKDPPGSTDYASTARGGKLLNPWNTKATNDKVAVVSLESLDAQDDIALKPEADVKFYLAMDFNKIDNKNFHDHDLYPVHAIQRNKHLYTPQINDISLLLPPSPPLTQPRDIPKDLFCDLKRDCKNEFCECVHVLKVKLGQVVELVMVDNGVTFDSNHPMHLHGNYFRVVALDKVIEPLLSLLDMNFFRMINTSVSLDEIKLLDRLGFIKRKLSGAIQKDTVTVPDGGYTVVRFYADNPGYWLFHCHLEFHSEIGMGLVFKVGEDEDMPKIPRDFPRCGSWKMADNPEFVDPTKRRDDCDTGILVGPVGKGSSLSTPCLSMLLIVLILKLL